MLQHHNKHKKPTQHTNYNIKQQRMTYCVLSHEISPCSDPQRRLFSCKSPSGPPASPQTSRPAQTVFQYPFKHVDSFKVHFFLVENMDELPSFLCSGFSNVCVCLFICKTFLFPSTFRAERTQLSSECSSVADSHVTE